jgi:hypothetical protein
VKEKAAGVAKAGIASLKVMLKRLGPVVIRATRCLCSSGVGGGDRGGEGGEVIRVGRGCLRRASVEVIIAIAKALIAMIASPWWFHRRRDAAAEVEITSAIRLQPSIRARVLSLSIATFSSASRASDSQASMASATWRARVGPLARRSVLAGGSESGALGGALGCPLVGASPPNVTRLFTGGGLTSSGGGRAWAATLLR